MAAKLPEVLIYPKLWHTYHQDSNDKPTVFDRGKLAESVLGVFKDDRQLKMADGTGNTYISETMKGTIKILTTNLWFKTLEVENSADKWV